MPSKSPAQHRLMEAVESVGQEFADADKAKSGKRRIAKALMDRKPR